MKNEYYVLKIYTKMHVFATLIIGAMTIINYESYGEAAYLNLKLERVELMIILALQCLTMCFAYPFFLYTKKKKIVIKGIPSYKFEIQKSKIDVFVMIILIAQILFTLQTGNGVVNGTVNSNLSFLFNIFKIQNFMPLYYMVARDTKKATYWINIVLYCIYQFCCGWSSFIMIIAFYELFLFAKYGKKDRLLNIIYKFNSIATIAAFGIGGYIYKYAYSIKNSIRYGFEFPPLDYMEGLEKLVSRLTNFPISVLGVQNHAAIAELYQKQGVWNWEVLSIFRSLIPGFLMPNKTYRSFSNLVLQSLYPNLSSNTSSGYCCWIYWANILEANFFCFILFIIVTVVLLIISKKIIYAFDDGSGKVDILYFLLIFNFFNGASVESLFAYNYIGLIYILPIMIFLGFIRVKKI